MNPELREDLKTLKEKSIYSVWGLNITSIAFIVGDMQGLVSSELTEIYVFGGIVVLFMYHYFKIHQFIDKHLEG